MLFAVIPTDDPEIWAVDGPTGDLEPGQEILLRIVKARRVDPRAMTHREALRVASAANDVLIRSGYQPKSRRGRRQLPPTPAFEVVRNLDDSTRWDIQLLGNAARTAVHWLNLTTDNLVGLTGEEAYRLAPRIRVAIKEVERD